MREEASASSATPPPPSFAGTAATPAGRSAASWRSWLCLTRCCRHATSNACTAPWRTPARCRLRSCPSADTPGARERRTRKGGSRQTGSGVAQARLPLPLSSSLPLPSPSPHPNRYGSTLLTPPDSLQVSHGGGWGAGTALCGTAWAGADFRARILTREHPNLIVRVKPLALSPSAARRERRAPIRRGRCTAFASRLGCSPAAGPRQRWRPERHRRDWQRHRLGEHLAWVPSAHTWAHPCSGAHPSSTAACPSLTPPAHTSPRLARPPPRAWRRRRRAWRRSSRRPCCRPRCGTPRRASPAAWTCGGSAGWPCAARSWCGARREGRAGRAAAECGGVFGGCTCRDCPFPSWLPSAPPAPAPSPASHLVTLAASQAATASSSRPSRPRGREERLQPHEANTCLERQPAAERARRQQNLTPRPAAVRDGQQLPQHGRRSSRQWRRTLLAVQPRPPRRRQGPAGRQHPI